MIFGIRLKKAKKYAKERWHSGWKAMVVWKEFIPPYVLEVVSIEYI
jgi:hypothetical protein